MRPCEYVRRRGKRGVNAFMLSWDFYFTHTHSPLCQASLSPHPLLSHSLHKKALFFCFGAYPFSLSLTYFLISYFLPLAFLFPLLHFHFLYYCSCVGAYIQRHTKLSFYLLLLLPRDNQKPPTYTSISWFTRTNNRPEQRAIHLQIFSTFTTNYCINSQSLTGVLNSTYSQ